MFEGTWQNDFGSELTVETIQPDGTFTGKFVTAVGDPVEINKEVPVNGRVAGELISFIADFADTASMTCWMGRYEQAQTGEERMHTVWTLGRTVEGEEGARVEMWASFLTNANVFQKGKAPS